MPLIDCPFCGLATSDPRPFCSRCGGEFRPAALDLVLNQLRTARTVIRNRAGGGVLDLLGAVGTVLKSDASLRESCRESIRWLEGEVEQFISDEANLFVVLPVGDAVAELLPPDGAPSAFRSVLARHRRLGHALAATEKTWSSGKPLKPGRVESWFTALTNAVNLGAAGARKCVYASPQRWPTVAAALDPVAFRSSRWRFHLAGGTKSLKSQAYDLARTEFEAALALRPACAPAFEGLGAVFAKLEDRERALDCFRDAVQADADEPRFHNQLAWNLCTLGTPTPAELDEAVWAARRGLELAPVPSIWDTLAEALERRGELPGAVAAIREAIRLNPTRGPYRERMARLCARLPRPTPPLTDSDSDIDLGLSLDSSAAESRTDFSGPGSNVSDAASRSGSEFELTLDDSGASLEQAAPESGVFKPARDKGDIFETDFEIPPLSAESGPEPMAMASAPDSEQSDCAADDSAILEEEPGSEAVLLDDEDESKPTAKRGKARKNVADDEVDVDLADDAPAPKSLKSTKGQNRTDVDDAGPRAATSGAGGGWLSKLSGWFKGAAVPVIDRVHFSVTAPATVEPGQAFALAVWAHLDSQRAEVMRRARDAHPLGPIQVHSKGAIRVARGTVLSVRLRAPAFNLGTSDSVDVIEWEGEIGNATFSVPVPVDLKRGSYPGVVEVYADGLQIAKVHFTIQVAHTTALARRLESREVRHQSAFASYASQDRDAVLARIQGIQKALPQLEIFVDVKSLRSGERWAERLEREVASRDVFYLFWSDHASASEWVEREWRAALRVRGIDYIDPVPLVDPRLAPPPPELSAALHFNDWVLAFMRGSPRT